MMSTLPCGSASRIACHSSQSRDMAGWILRRMPHCGSLTSLYGHAETSHRRVETLFVASYHGQRYDDHAHLSSLAAYHGPPWLLGLTLVATVVGGGTLGALMGWYREVKCSFVLALLVLSDIPIAWSNLLPAIAAAAGSAALSVLLGVVWRPRTIAPRSILASWQRRAARGLASLNRRQHYVAVLLRPGVSCSHGCWQRCWASAIRSGLRLLVAPLMPALAWPEIYRRMANLVLGTLLGVGLSAVLFSWKPNHLALITIIVLAQMATEAFIRRQYGVALVSFAARHRHE